MPALKSVRMFNLAVAAILLAGGTALAEIKVSADYNENDKATANFKFKNVPSPSKDDAATKAKFTLVDGQRDPNGARLACLHDGELPTEEDDPEANFFFNAATAGGRIGVDLGSPIEIKQINTYSWHPNTRGAQLYKVYASDGADHDFKTDPKTGADPLKLGWKLIAKVDTRPKTSDGGGQHGVSIADSAGSIGKFRYLLFDISRLETDDNFDNTFYSEIDVIEKK
jgi:hypothetical protein